MRATDDTSRVKISDNIIWQLDVCNACRYCEGYCAVFPALERRRRLTGPDIIYLANLCHDCRACYYACMYAPPHEFGVNVPQALAEVREQTYAQYALPRIVTNLAPRNAAIAIVTLVISLLVFVLVAQQNAGLGQAQTGAGAFYAVVPYLWMMLPALALSVYAVGVMLVGAFAFLRDTKGNANWSSGDVFGALKEAFTLRYLRGGNAGGCYYPTERTSNARLILHMLVFYGFLSATIATIAAFILQDGFGQLPPYAWLSVPVIFGAAGGIAMIVGATGMLYLKWRSDRAPADGKTYNLDWLFLVSLDIVALTGMLLLVLRESALMPALLVIHIATVLALYVSAPYGKFAHFVYRIAALVQNRLEERQRAGAHAH